MTVSKGYTLIELMIAVLLVSFLSIVLTTNYVALKKRFQGVMQMSVVQEDASFLIDFLRKKINEAGDFSCMTLKQQPMVIQLFSKAGVPHDVRTKLNNISDVLILGTCDVSQGKKQWVQTAYYVAHSSWKERGHDVDSFFEKPLNGSRQEMVSHVIDFTVRSIINSGHISGVTYELKFSLNNGSFRTWYGVGALRHE